MDNTEDLDIVMERYNMLEHSDNYSMTPGSLRNDCRHKVDNVNDNASDSKSFKYKPKITGKTEARPAQRWKWQRRRRTTTRSSTNFKHRCSIPLKYLSNFWRSLDFPLINCEVALDLLWAKDCLLVEQNNNITGIDFKITSNKLYASEVTLSINKNIKLLYNIK